MPRKSKASRGGYQAGVDRVNENLRRAAIAKELESAKPAGGEPEEKAKPSPVTQAPEKAKERVEILLAVDPGVKSAVAVFTHGVGWKDLSLVEIIDTPVTVITRGRTSRTSVNTEELHQALGKSVSQIREKYAVTAYRAVVEAVSAAPGQGVSSMFSFGKSAGIFEGLLIGMGYEFSKVSPVTWKGALKLRGGVVNKDKSRALATELWGDMLFERKKDGNRAEAALIGYWFYRQQGGK